MRQLTIRSGSFGRIPRAPEARLGQQIICCLPKDGGPARCYTTAGGKCTLAWYDRTNRNYPPCAGDRPPACEFVEAAPQQPGLYQYVAPPLPAPTQGGMADGTQTPQNMPAAAPADTSFQDWPEPQRSTLQALVSKYGAPDEVGSDRAIFRDRAPWAIILVERRGVPHHWPYVHQDFLVQLLRYPVDPSKYGDLASFDGSLILLRSPGIFGSSCDSEQMNVAAINIGQSVAQGQMGVSEARDRLTRIAQGIRSGAPGPEALYLRFPIPARYHGNPDSPKF